jgi:DNA-binding LacI/PurR family transcriptional regulator
VSRLANAAQDRARELGVELHHHFAPSSQPQIGSELARLLDAHPDATGLLLNNEAAAAALPSVLRDRGLTAPEDISVIGRYSDDFARTFSLPYTAIDSAADELGRRAVERLVSRIESTSDAEPPIVDLITPRIDDRGSTAVPPARH